MKTEITEQLKQIELALLKGTSKEDIISHFAEVQKQFESLTKQQAESLKAIEQAKKERGELEYQISNLRTEIASLKSSLNAATETIRLNATTTMRWEIEREYASSLITTLKDVLSAALTRSALKGSSIFDFNGYLPGNGSSGNLSGHGEVKAGTEEIKPSIK